MNRPETIADIVAYLRNPRNVVAATRIQCDLADRIEAAAWHDYHALEVHCKRLEDEYLKASNEALRFRMALAKVRGCADSTCGEMGVCRACEVMGVGK